MENDNLKNKLIEEYIFLNSIKSKNFTKNFLKELGKEMDEMFQGVTYVMGLRYKSTSSSKMKIEKILSREDGCNKNIYDNIGFKIVVNHVSDKVQHAHCQDIIQKREKYNNERQEKEAHKDNLILELKDLLADRTEKLLQEVKNIDERYYNNFKFMIEIATTNKDCDNINSYRKIIEELEKFISKNMEKNIFDPKEKMIKDYEVIIFNNDVKNKLELLKEVYENIDNKIELYSEQDRKCNDLYSEYMTEQIKNNSKVLKNLGISSIPGRYKRHTGSKHYYVASHNSFKSTKKSELEGWKIEMQVTSDYYNQDATEGKAKHSEKEGKARVLPNIPNSIQKYQESVKKVIPETLVYISGTGNVIECSDYENFYLYYKEVITGPQYLKNLDKALNTSEENENVK